MFFFGALSGNLIYLILVFSYLAGFSAMALQSPEKVTLQNNSTDHSICITEPSISINTSSTYFYSQDLSTDFQATENDNISLSPPIDTTTALFVELSCPEEPLFIAHKLFARPPPVAVA